jgi:8-oxo-dGTP pyrophosphatase MutT (NUDIX family)
MELPMYDTRGGSLVSFARLDDTFFEGLDGAVAPACSLVVVGWDQRVLVGFNVTRQQWELPGGSLEVGESAYERSTSRTHRRDGHSGRTSFARRTS